MAATGTRRRLVLVLVLGGVLATAAIVVLAVLGTGGEDTAGGPVSSTPALTVAEARVIESTLASTDPADVATVLSDAVGPAYLRDPQPLLPNGSALRIDITEFRETSPGLATVAATLTGPRPGRWLLLLTYEDGWLVYGTSPVSTP
ncbi:MAG: hypothetical protein GEV28_36855 [Actinophytocola sp.]|uniref:hypothetical protein n=1 Tax=Actinophytocola sp. TaxID=1872138 RepID=UPI001328A0F7|nr:hypothetical protein [Actinophytocola sp.]MPZ85654.1 hypothetical protein [Actinophytocola sp.]